MPRSRARFTVGANYSCEAPETGVAVVVAAMREREWVRVQGRGEKLTKASEPTGFYRDARIAFGRNAGVR